MVEEDICANAMLYIYKIYRIALAQMSSLAYRPTVGLLELKKKFHINQQTKTFDVSVFT